MCEKNKQHLQKKSIRKKNRKIRKKKKISQQRIRRQSLKTIKIAQKRKNKHLRNKKRKVSDHVKWSVIKFSKELYIDDPSEELIRKINEISPTDNIRLNFSAVQKISVSSALYIKAYVDSRKELQNIKISCSKNNKKMREILQHMKLKNYNLRISHKDIKCWSFKQWSKNNPENYAKVLMEDILPKVLIGRNISDKFSEIASGLHELLANCCEHAYTDHDIFVEYYFIAGEYENSTRRSNNFTFCIIDMGQGFKASLLKNAQFSNKLKEEIDLMQDKDFIKAAINANPNKNSGRGTGLPEVKNKVKSINGVLQIYSDYGTYIFQNNTDSYSQRKNSIKGSVIIVTLPIT